MTDHELTDEQVTKIILTYFHGFSREQWEREKENFPYSVIPHLVRAVWTVARTGDADDRP